MSKGRGLLAPSAFLCLFLLTAEGPREKAELTAAPFLSSVPSFPLKMARAAIVLAFAFVCAAAASASAAAAPNTLFAFVGDTSCEKKACSFSSLFLSRFLSPSVCLLLERLSRLEYAKRLSLTLGVLCPFPVVLLSCALPIVCAPPLFDHTQSAPLLSHLLHLLPPFPLSLARTAREKVSANLLLLCARRRGGVESESGTASTTTTLFD